MHSFIQRRQLQQKQGSMVSLLAATLLLASAWTANATVSRPLADQGPTTVYVAMGLLDVDEIDSANQSFVANLFYEVRWNDPRLAHKGPGRKVLNLNDVWHPQLLFVNQQKIWPTFPEVVHIEPDGEVTYRQRVWGPFSQPLEVKDFPFDTQDFEMRMASADFRPHDVEFMADPNNPSGLAPTFSLPDWKVLGWELDFTPYNPLGKEVGVSSFSLIFHAQRYRASHILKVILPLILIVAMSWIVFWIDPKQAGTQIGTATTSMLTLIAYRFMVGGMIPAVPYLTRMDYFILGSTILVFAALVLATLTSLIAESENGQLANRIDNVCRVIFPLVFTGIAAASFML